MKNIKLVFTVFVSLVMLSCNKTIVTPKAVISTTNWVNFAHIDKLYGTAKLANGTQVGTIGIYADYPDYHLVSAQNEGYTCVDDVARTGILYLNESDITTNTGKQAKLLSLTEFVLQMQNANGYFNNFLNDDNTINTSYQTSVATADWWSWRAMWHLSMAFDFYKNSNPTLAARIKSANDKLIVNIKRDLVILPINYKTVNGLNIPTYLPAGSGTDQAAVMLMGLVNVFKQNKDVEIQKIIEQLATGIISTQRGNVTQLPYGAFMSWENLWHAYGCDQSFALLTAAQVLNKPEWIGAAQTEIDNFYPYLLREGFVNQFENQIAGQISKTEVFSQISYGIRPMVSACVEMYKIKNDKKYLTQAGKILSWYVGNNLGKIKMYDKTKGLCFDGLASTTDYNKNGGAESTIEALWAMQLADKYPEIAVEINKFQ